MPTISIPCEPCSGTVWATHEDRHTKTRQDQCRTCCGTGQVLARPGESRETSWPDAVSEAKAYDLDETAAWVRRDNVLMRIEDAKALSQFGGTRGGSVRETAPTERDTVRDRCFLPILSLGLLSFHLKSAEVLHIATRNAVYELEQAENFGTPDHFGFAKFHYEPDCQVSHRVKALFCNVSGHAQLPKQKFHLCYCLTYRIQSTRKIRPK
jgi:hypothetical protein